MMQVEHDDPMALKNLIGIKAAPQNIYLFLWRLLNNLILTKDNLELDGVF
jgi:hypothetical protein